MRPMLMALTLLWFAIYLIDMEPKRKSITYMPGFGISTPAKYGDVCIVNGRVVSSPWICAPDPTSMEELIERRGNN